MRMRLDYEVFNFWKDNRIDGFFQLNLAELIEKFNAFLQAKKHEKEWFHHYPVRTIVMSFITDKVHGLSSTANDEKNYAEVDAMEMNLKPIIKAFLKDAA